MHGTDRPLLSASSVMCVLQRRTHGFRGNADQTEARCAELKGTVCARLPACWAGPKCLPAKPVRSGGGNPWGSSPAHLIVTLPRPCEAPSVTPKTPPGASRGLGSRHSIPRGDGAVGPPRSGFVLRLCIRKADEA